jgi:hypothetical protein
MELLERQQRPLYITNHVVGETYTLMRMRVGHAPAQQFLRKIRESALVRRVFVQEAWEEEAELLLARYADQDFSYIDATSFVTMHRLRISEAFTFDHHFLVAGFALVAD